MQAKCTNPDDKLCAKLGELGAVVTTVAGRRVGAAACWRRSRRSRASRSGTSAEGRTGPARIRKTIRDEIRAMPGAGRRPARRDRRAVPAAPGALGRRSRAGRGAGAPAQRAGWSSTTCWCWPATCSRASDDARATLHERYQRLLLDEFQDTDPIQIELAVRIAGGRDAARSGGRTSSCPRAGSSWSATRSSRSTASAGPASPPTSTRRPRIGDRQA